MSAYVAQGVFRNGHINSVLSGSPLRRLALKPAQQQLNHKVERILIPAQHDIYLSALINRQPHHAPTVMLLHGWLGCAHSLYLISLAQTLHHAGYHVIRLNLRDHGDSQHLNKKLFHSCRIQEVINACIYCQDHFQSPLSLVGFSLGGNFALRVNAYAERSQLELDKTIAYCPVIDPESTLLALENTVPIYKYYFMHRWRNEFRKKVHAFPDLYCLSTFDQATNLREATDNLATVYAGFNDLESYLNGYSIAGTRLQTLQSQAYTVLAKDDPIIPWQDKDKCHAHPKHHLLISEYGGHCGFLDPNLDSQWINQYTLTCLND